VGGLGIDGRPEMTCCGGRTDEGPTSFIGSFMDSRWRGVTPFLIAVTVTAVLLITASRKESAAFISWDARLMKSGSDIVRLRLMGGGRSVSLTR
jgi:hypothetical protein